MAPANASSVLETKRAVLCRVDCVPPNCFSMEGGPEKFEMARVAQARTSANTGSEVLRVAVMPTPDAARRDAYARFVCVPTLASAETVSTFTFSSVAAISQPRCRPNGRLPKT